MQTRIIEFVAALRAAGVRVSVAESVDALRAVEQAGSADRDRFRAALQTTLVKEAHDLPVFRRLFPIYFGEGLSSVRAPALQGDLSGAEQQLLQQAVAAIMATLPQPQAALFAAIAGGQRIDREQIDALLAAVPLLQLNHPYYQNWMARRALRELGFEQLDLAIAALLEQLRELGMAEAALQTVEQAARANREALAGQVGQSVARRHVEQALSERERQAQVDDLLERPFERLNYQEMLDLRGTIMRLVLRLRSRAALRRRRCKSGLLDAKATIRASLRFGGVPLAIRHRRRPLRPKLVVICDVSTSMRPVVSFMLMLVYGLHDQARHTRSFAFIADIEEISADFVDARPAQAIETILRRIRPNYARTDLGNSLNSFVRSHLGYVDRRTTVIVLGDGRNNYNDPGLAALRTIRERARRLIWFNPEPRNAWSTGDSDMLQYAPLCSAVHIVSNMRELAEAVDALLA